MLQPAAICRNKVQAELKAERKSLSQQRVFCCNTVEEECKHYCCDTLNSVETMIKANDKGTLSQQSFLCHNIKGWRLINELCRDRKWHEYNTSQLRQMFLCCDKVFSVELA